MPLHTAGIIPSIHYSKRYGRVMFYDFAGDAEYYSSHAAIFQSLASSRIGDNIFLLVVNLREDLATIEATLHFWFSFIQHQKFNKSSIAVVGSHFDSSSKDCGEKCNLLAKSSSYINFTTRHQHFSLDCRDPRSNQITMLKDQIAKWIKQSQRYCISYEADLLLGLIEKDFSAVTACSLQTLSEHSRRQGCVYSLMLSSSTPSLRSFMKWDCCCCLETNLQRIVVLS